MLNKDDIVSIISSGEGYNAEFKVRVPNKLKELSEEICAFANAAGGVLLLGVDDSNVIQGVSIDNAKLSAIQNSLNEITPHLTVDIYKVDIEGEAVCVIEVESGSRKPYVLSGAIYVRQGPNSQKLTSVEQMRDFFQQAERIYFDEAPCPSFSLHEDLDLKWFEEFRVRGKLSAAVSQDQIVKNLKLVLPEGKVKNGGVLFLGAEPQKFIDTALIRCTAFDGTDKIHISDDKFWKGPLIKQYEQAMQWLREKLNVRYEISGGGPRKEIWEVPETAFKEAIINALAHRDYYDKGATTSIALFSDRVEISNPGGLSNAIPLSEFGTKSHSRNPLIFGLFERIDMVEQVGSGIGRIKDEMNKAGLSVPEFKTEGMFTVVLKRKESSGKSSGKSSGNNPSASWNEVRLILQQKSENKLGKSALKIVEMIFNNSEITIPEMAKHLNITERGTEKNIQKLKESKLIARIDGTKGGYWKLLKEDNDKE
jgi:ATP-dependent DNA helicase RecG